MKEPFKAHGACGWDERRRSDLAGVESTHPDGTRESFTSRGKDYFALVPSYSHDGRHLNEPGRRAVAEALLVFLANLP